MTIYNSKNPIPLVPKHSLRWWRHAFLFSLFNFALLAAAQSKTSFDVPVGDASKTLRLFAEKSGEQIVYPIDVVRGISTNAVKGEYSSREALEAMLAGTGLVVVMDPSNGALAVTRSPAPNTVQKPVGLQAATVLPNAEGANQDLVVLDTFFVSGMKESMMKAQQNKQNSLQLTESIVADDINKLPDLSVTEALQRVTGISVTRELGEGAGVALRGLSEVSATLNGQEVFSPQVVTGESRIMNMQTIPAEMVSAINVIKTPNADMIEGGIAGTIDIRLRRPLDFKGGLNGSLTARLEHGQAADSSKPQFSGMITDTWKVGRGKFGALVNYTVQERDIRQDINSNGKPTVFNLSTTPVVGYDGSYETRILANRKREGASGVIQWEPFKKLRMFVEYDFSVQKTIQDSYAAQFVFPSTRLADSVDLYPLSVLADHDNNSSTPMVATPVVRSSHVINGTFAPLSTTRDWKERTNQFTTGATWRDGNFVLEAEFSATKARSNFDNLGVMATVSGISYTQNVDRDIPSIVPDDPSSITVANVANYRWSYWYYNYIVNEADSTAATINATHSLGQGSPFRRVKYGIRVAERSAKNNKVAVSGGIPGVVADYPALYRPASVTDFLDGESGKVNNFLEVNTSAMHNYATFAQLIGANPSLPLASPGALFNITEKTKAAYGLTDFEIKSFVRFDGNIGVRVVGTDVEAGGFKKNNGIYTPIVENGDYTDVLPSLNTRWFIQDNFFLRLSLSKQLSRQSFGKLNPNVQLNPPASSAVMGTGSAGNPSLKPLRTNQIDVSLEKYFNASTSLYVSGYYKKIDGYTQSGTTIENWDGIDYQISRPYAVNDARIRGVEVGYQQFFTFLPAPFDGLGALANYTYVDAEDPLGNPLTTLSRNSYNAILMYEKAKWTVRLAYNWRDRFVRSNNNATGIGPVSIYDNAFGWLDGSLAYRVNDHLKLSFDVSNALRTRRTSYYSQSVFQHEDVLEDRQFYLSASLSL